MQAAPPLVRRGFGTVFERGTPGMRSCHDPTSEANRPFRRMRAPMRKRPNKRPECGGHRPRQYVIRRLQKSTTGGCSSLVPEAATVGEEEVRCKPGAGRGLAGRKTEGAGSGWCLSFLLLFSLCLGWDDGEEIREFRGNRMAWNAGRGRNTVTHRSSSSRII